MDHHWQVNWQLSIVSIVSIQWCNITDICSNRMHHTWTRFVSLNASAIDLCSHMREYARLWAVFLSTAISIQSFMFTYLFYSLLVVRSNALFVTWFCCIIISYLLAILFALTRACALVDKKNRSVAKQNRVLYVRFGKNFPMPLRYLLKVRWNLL